MGTFRMETPARGPLRPEVVSGVLSDAYERRILSVCIRAARAVKDISQETGLPLATAYRHVGRLLEAGVLVVERSAMTPDGKKYDMYRSRVRAARIEMDASGERVSWEPNEPVEERLVGIWDSLRVQVGRK